MHSLRFRYLLVAVSSVLCVMALIILEHYYINVASEKHLSNIQSRVEVRHVVDVLKHDLEQATRQLDLYMIDPTIATRTHFSKLLQATTLKINVLKNDKWLVENNLENEVSILNEQLGKLNTVAILLMKTRLVANEMFPAMRLANGSMFDSNQTVVTLINYEIEESVTEGYASGKIYALKVDVRDSWRKTINAYRLYLINRLGSLFEEGLSTQVKDVHSLYRETLRKMRQLASLRDEEAMGFESSESIVEIIRQAEAWYTGFNEVEVINRSDKWRGDVPIIINKIYPIIDGISASIDKLYARLNVSAANDLKAQHTETEQITLALWVLFLLMVSVMIFSYLMLDNSLLRPIARLATSLGNTAKGNDEPVPVVNNREMMEFVGAFNHMREQIKTRQDQLEHLAMHDSLTALPNRTLLIDRLNSAISYAQRHKLEFALMILDMDRFKEVNDTLGHLVGDKLLCEVAIRLKRLLRDSDTVARLGGDEFAIILTDINDENVQTIADKISEELEKVYQIGDHNLYLSVSLGITIYPEHGETSEALMKFSDVAMYKAKNSTSHSSVYDPQGDMQNTRKLSLLSDLRMAVDNNELVLHFQPINNLNSLEILGFEALIRWDHPRFGMVGPDNFIPLAEQTGMIRKITRWVLEEATTQVKPWHALNPKIYVSINVTAWDLYDINFVDAVYDCLNKQDLPSSAILLELSERSMMTETLRVTETMQRMSGMGMRFAVDDFGTGFSSMVYLKQLPIKILKIDKSFVFGMAGHKNDALIVNSIIDLAHNLEMDVIAEGVENEITRNQLIESECDCMQGYLVSKPVPADDALRMLKRGTLKIVKNNNP